MYNLLIYEYSMLTKKLNKVDIKYKLLKILHIIDWFCIICLTLFLFKFNL